MQLEIKCLECQKRTRSFEIGPAAYPIEGGNEILLKDKIFCPKCKKDISNGKCIARESDLLISLMAITVGALAGREDKTFKIPPHLQGMTIFSKECYHQLKAQCKGAITLVTKL